MRRNSLMMGAGVAALAAAALLLTPVSAKPVAANRDAAIKACSTVNPSQPVKVVNAGESLRRLSDRRGQGARKRLRRT